jgi:hypothetical protein
MGSYIQFSTGLAGLEASPEVVLSASGNSATFSIHFT